MEENGTTCQCRNKAPAATLRSEPTRPETSASRRVCVTSTVAYRTTRGPRDDIWRRVNPAPLAPRCCCCCCCSSPRRRPQPLGAIRASRLSSAAARAAPFSSIFPSLFSAAGPFSQPEKRKNHSAPAGPLHPLAVLLPLLRTQIWIYLAQICPCVISVWGGGNYNSGQGSRRRSFQEGISARYGPPTGRPSSVRGLDGRDAEPGWRGWGKRRKRMVGVFIRASEMASNVPGVSI